MTAKEKANDLINKFAPYTNDWGNIELYKIESALICVNEMLGNTDWLGVIAINEYRKYWDEVKEELEKLREIIK